MKKNFSAEAIRKLDFVLIGSRLEFLLDITFSGYSVLDSALLTRALTKSYKAWN